MSTDRQAGEGDKTITTLLILILFALLFSSLGLRQTHSPSTRHHDHPHSGCSTNPDRRRAQHRGRGHPHPSLAEKEGGGSCLLWRYHCCLFKRFANTLCSHLRHTPPPNPVSDCCCPLPNLLHRATNPTSRSSPPNCGVTLRGTKPCARDQAQARRCILAQTRKVGLGLGLGLGLGAALVPERRTCL
jgi:hypothetical protein